MKQLVRFIPLLLLLMAGIASPAEVVVRHELQVTLQPARGELQVRDRLTLPPGAGATSLELHAGLSPRIDAGRATLLPLGRSGARERFLLRPAPGERQVTLRYAGRIQHPLTEIDESPGRSHRQTQGYIGGEGVFLDGAGGWYPRLPDSLQTFSLEVTLPRGWLAVSQGKGPTIETTADGTRVRWTETRAQDDIYLVAAPFRLYRRATPVAEAQVWLRRPDDALAERYLEVTERYLGLYSRLLGDYPYPKFALVENFWESGYGMPSFTLLGPRVIRLPFIPYTSYPHEILHNWWGNGVYVDYAAGNWSEGLTTYLADHLLREQRGSGAGYRRSALQRYADYAREGRDFPLRAFRARHGAASQSVGYDKGMMLFHMLRLELGDAAFVAGLRRFYRDNLFKVAGFAELRRAFEEETGKELKPFFDQWLERTGAPTLALSAVRVQKAGDGFLVSGRLQQTQDAAPFRLRVPLLVHREGGPPLEAAVVLEGRETEFHLNPGSRPLRLDVDPRFDLFRTLYPEESPPTLSNLFGADRGLILLPSAAPEALLAGYRELAARWSRGHEGWAVRADDTVDELPSDRPTWLLGWENRFLPRFRQRLKTAAAISATGVTFGKDSFARAGHSVALVAPAAEQALPPLAWLGAHDAAALPGLARKLPHYGKYGRLVFSGTEPANVRKEQWPVAASPLSVPLVEGAETLLPPARPPLRAP